MTSTGTQTVSRRTALPGWLAGVNSQVSQWVASTSWWRLIALFLVLLITGSILSEQLGLRHERVRVARSQHKSVMVTIGGPNGIRIGETPKEAPAGVQTPETPVPPAVPGASGAESAAKRATPRADARDEDDDDKDVPNVMGWRRVVTFRGILGDLGAAALTLLFAYLVAAKMIVRKTAESDAKVRSAVDAAEREAMERQLVQARLMLLQAQVEPHFLFNTLAAVDYLIETDSRRASVMQKALITYLRGALPQMRQESSTLGRELQLIRSYLDLMKMRIEDRLEVEIRVPAELESAMFPPMMLQSLVENAIKHGIEPKPEGGKITVGAKVQNGQLWVEVQDTGVGLPDGELLDGPTTGTGLGLTNIRERLGMLFPGKSRLTLRSDDTTGTLVRIAVPYQPGTP